MTSILKDGPSQNKGIITGDVVAEVDGVDVLNRGVKCVFSVRSQIEHTLEYRAKNGLVSCGPHRGCPAHNQLLQRSGTVMPSYPLT